MAQISLRSLAPEYQEASHASYLRHLNDAVKDVRAKNIALTGRYGAGKSSILDKFLEGQIALGRKTLRISINTLGPADDDDITNRIQKELVKQLVYRAKPGAVRRSRFARPKQLTWWRALIEAAGFTIALVGLLWLFGIRAGADALGTGDLALPTGALALLVLGAAFAARLIIGDRLVTQVSTGGTSIEFEKRPDSYLDEYLDEIVAFFEATKPDIVVFEDLDRFDDARIFDSLRELNTLINASSFWSARKGHPVRFIYAIKDSLFEKLGEDQDDKDRESVVDTQSDQNAPTALQLERSSAATADTAAAEIERANRTKFFEIVIPVVPFLSHSNARDLFGDVLRDLQLPEETTISRQLLDLVASHATDMRLMINIANEFVVYGEKLLWPATRAPGISANDLFALVVYKNFHLSDFESLPHRGSALDKLESRRRLLVQEGIARLQRERRDLLRGDTLRDEQNQLAEKLGKRLMKLVNGAQVALVDATVGTGSFDEGSLQQPPFWSRVAEVGELVLMVRNSAGYTPTAWTFDREQLEGVFNEGMVSQRWATEDAHAVLRKRAEFDEEIAALRGASFARLANDSRYRVADQSFGRYVEVNLKSELARDLVRRGFITRYYAEYSSMFYGKYLGVDVANYFRNCIWPNEMQEQFAFDSADSIANLLEQAPSGFTSSRSALNIQILDYMLAHRSDLAQEIVKFLVTETSADSIAFLDAFLNADGSRSDDLTALLAAFPWPKLFDHLVREESTPDPDSRAQLLNTALLNARDASAYELGDAAREQIISLHSELPAFTQEQTAEALETLMSFVTHARLVVPSLSPLSAALQRRVVEARQYELTASNLRDALGMGGNEPLTLERIRPDANVWLRIAEDASAYFDVVDQDEQTPHSVMTSDVLGDVIRERYETWSPGELNGLLGSSALGASLPDISDIPQTVWQPIAEARRMVPNPTNLHTYTAALGLDAALVVVLTDEEGNVISIVDIESADTGTVHSLTMAILNASGQLTPSQRISLVLQLREPQGDIDVTEITPTGDDLLARLLEAGLVPDTEETFSHFSAAGWESIANAFTTSRNARTFVTPAMLGAHAAEILSSENVPADLKAQILEDLESYAAVGGADFLSSSAATAYSAEIPLTLARLELVAPHVSDVQQVLGQLAKVQEPFDGPLVLRILSLLGNEFEGFNGPSGHTFDVPKSDAATSVLNHLKDAGYVHLPPGGRNDVRRVSMV